MSFEWCSRVWIIFDLLQIVLFDRKQGEGCRVDNSFGRGQDPQSLARRDLFGADFPAAEAGLGYPRRRRSYPSSCRDEARLVGGARRPGPGRGTVELRDTCATCVLTVASLEEQLAGDLGVRQAPRDPAGAP